MTEKNDLSPGMAQYMEIKKAHQDYLLFYRMGDFYELFFDDAVTASQALDIALTKRGKIQGKEIPMCGVPFHAYEQYLARLIKQGYKVAICEQMENPEEARKRGYKAVVRREVVRLVTPGTITEETLLDSRRNNYLLAVSKNKNTLGLAWIDLSTGVFYTEELAVTPQTMVAEFYSILARILPGEIIVPDSMLTNPELFKLLNEYRERLTPLPEGRFSELNAYKKLCDFYKVKTLEAFGQFSSGEITAAGIVLDYVEQTQKGKTPRIAHPLKVLGHDFMEIDAATRHNLDLLEGPKGKTLISVIDRTITGAGGRMLASRLTAPLLDVQEINNRLDIIDFFIKHQDVRCKLREALHNCPDMERAISRLSVGRGGPRDLFSIMQTLAALPELRTMLETYKRMDVVDEIPSAVTKVLQRFGKHYTLLSALSGALEEENLPLLPRDGNFIRQGYNPELDAVREMREKGHSYILNLQSKYAEVSGIEQLKIKYNNVVGYFIEVPNKVAAQLLDKPEFIHRQSVLNATRFTTVELTELENNIRGAAEKALAIELAVFDSLVRDVLVEADKIIESANALAELDIGAAMADLALEKNYCRPLVDGSLIFDIEEGRHPIVEASITKNNEGVFVGNDCSLNVENNRIWLLTGPNMAGKSTFLRQNAIMAVLAQMGAYVPAKSAHIGVVDKVFSRVGASDDLSQGRSTFMVEMLETAAILNRAGERSFVILDEIGRGTATFDGLSIAWAVVEYLHEKNKSRSLFATHYHEMVNLAGHLKALTLHCMKIREFKDEVIFLHEVISGAADRSYGIHVAKLAGLPADVIERANQVLHELEKENNKKIELKIEQELPLFSLSRKEKTKEPSAVEQALKEINPDTLTAREALMKLYDLKEMMNKEN